MRPVISFDSDHWTWRCHFCGVAWTREATFPAAVFGFSSHYARIHEGPATS